MQRWKNIGPVNRIKPANDIIWFFFMSISNIGGNLYRYYLPALPVPTSANVPVHIYIALNPTILP